MAELIAIGNTQADSADFTAPKTLYIKGNQTGSIAQVDFLLQHKTSGGAYDTALTLTANNINDLGNVVGAGTFRVRRLASSAQAGMDIE